MAKSSKKKYYIFQDGNDIMFVANVPTEQLDGAMVRAFKEEIHTRGLEQIIFDNLEEIIKDANQGEIVRIGGLSQSEEQKESEEIVEEIEEEEIDPGNLPFVIDVTPDSMQAFLEMEKPSDDISRRYIDFGLEFVGISHGIIEKNIEKILAEWPELFKVLIAEGTPPEAGRDAELELVKELKNNLTPQITEEGIVDFKQLNLISPIKAGEILQIRTPPTPGKPGFDVFGNTIESTPGVDKKLKKGQNTGINEDGTQLISQKGGFLHLGPHGEINVRPVYTVDGDVDYSTGNVQYKNDVFVKGDVRAGFMVKAGGDVHITGAVEDAVVEAKGNVNINGGVLSSGKAIIRADGDVSVGFVQNALLEAGGSVFIRIESVGSRISAGKDVEVIRHGGRILGGDLSVGGWVVAQVIGSENSPPLRIVFNGRHNLSGGLDERYEYCFVSTKSVESSIKVQFGSLVAGISDIEPPVTISLKDKQIVFDKLFIGPDELKRLRRERDSKEKSAI